MALRLEPFFHYDLFGWHRYRASAVALGLARETHAPLDGGISPPLQVSLSCSDGFGRTILTKVQAEDGPASVYDSDVRVPPFGGWPATAIRFRGPA